MFNLIFVSFEIRSNSSPIPTPPKQINVALILPQIPQPFNSTYFQKAPKKFKTAFVKIFVIIPLYFM